MAAAAGEDARHAELGEVEAVTDGRGMASPTLTRFRRRVAASASGLRAELTGGDENHYKNERSRHCGPLVFLVAAQENSQRPSTYRDPSVTGARSLAMLHRHD